MMKKSEMAWHEPGGDDKEKDPWQGPQKSKQGPPDLDDVLRNLSRKLGRFGGRKGGGPGGGMFGFGAGIVLAILLVVWALSGLYTVPEASRGVLLRFGKFVELVQPGLHWKPTFVDSVRVVDVEAMNSIPTQGFMLTKDENVVQVAMDVQYRIAEPYQYLFSVEDPEDSLLQAMDSALRYVVGHTKMDTLLTKGRAQLREDVINELRVIMEPYKIGLQLVKVNIQQVRPPDEVKDAFDDAIGAQEDEQRFIREAEAYAREIEPKARGRVKRILEEATAYKQKVILDAQGEVTRFERLLPEYKQAPEVTRRRMYLETIEKVMSNTPKVLVDDKTSSSMMYLPLDKLMERRSATNSATDSDGVDSSHSGTSSSPITSYPTTSTDTRYSDRYGSGRDTRQDRFSNGRGN